MSAEKTSCTHSIMVATITTRFSFLLLFSLLLFCEFAICVCFIFEMIAFLFDYISLVKYVPFSFVRLGATSMN